MFWAWERPEDLRDLPPTAGVAYLAATIALRDTGAVVLPRRHRVEISPVTPLMAVTRLEVDRNHPPSLDAALASAVADEITAVTRRPAVRALQIDFDATASERPFYRTLLQTLRRQMPREQGLSITALASWCMFDRWMDGLPVDEIVPMLFRMGDLNDARGRRAGTAGEWRARECGAAVGLSTDEPLPLERRDRRVYLFHPAPWTPHEARAHLSEAESWR